MPPDINESKNVEFQVYARIVAPQLLIGKSSSGDFTTAYASANTITLGTAPYTHTFLAADIIGIQQYNIAGEFVRAFTPIDTLFSITTSVLTVTGATFSNTDTFIVYTNLSRTNATGDSTSNAAFTQNTRLNPDWAHVIDEEPFSAQAVDATSTPTDVLGYYDIGFNITDAVCDGVLTVLDEDDATLEFKLNGADVTSFTGAASGTNIHTCQLVNCKPKQVKFKLTGRSTGSMSVHLKAL